MKTFFFSLVLAASCASASAGDEKVGTDVSELKRQLAMVTAEANALWSYVQSGIENPNIAALNRAADLRDARRSARRR